MSTNIIPWKGQTLNGINSFIAKNTPSEPSSIAALFKSKPLKLYRREIGTHHTNNCNEKTLSIDYINRPGGSITKSEEVTEGIPTIIDINIPNNSCHNDNTCLLSFAENARRRVRSSGMIRTKYDASRNNDTYHTTTKEYLTSRSKTFTQNQYNYIRQGDSSVKPGSSLSTSNTYSSQGKQHCKKYYINVDTSFKYVWLDGVTEVTVNVPIGYYDITDLNNLLQTAMLENNHFIIKTPSGTFTNYLSTQHTKYFLHITFNDNLHKVELQSFKYNNTLYPDSTYSVPADLDNTPYWDKNIDSFPQFKLEQNDFTNIIGFTDANQTLYPDTPQLTSNNTVLINNSFTKPKIFPLYNIVYYKPNNYQFAQQGAVSSGDLITRRRFNTINSTAATYRGAYGDAVANSLAYGVPSNGYTIKDKLGYPTKQTPVVTANGEFKRCNVTKISQLI
tara:strand:- start:3999 stop:5339 length:1341 start_codon:yes stop_codon:yes gene_type:complete